MSRDALKLTTYFGERDRAGGAFVADALADVFARHELAISLLLRGVEGFGLRRHLHTDRLLTLSEELPLVSEAVDAPARIEPVRAEVERLTFDGLVTVERALMPDPDEAAGALAADPRAETKLTLYLGRHERLEGRPAHQVVVERLHSSGVSGATVLLGVDGTVHGARQRGRFFAGNAQVPLMVIAVGQVRHLAAAAAGLTEGLEQPLLTLERVQVCKRDGRVLRAAERLPERDPEGRELWQKLMVYSSEQAQVDGMPLHQALIRELRLAGAAGATCLRGIWGYHGAHAPHGDSFWQLRRRAPIVTVIVDSPARVARWLQIVDRLTRSTGLVTSELVPARRAGADPR